MNDNNKTISDRNIYKVSQKDLIQAMSTKYCKDYSEVEDFVLKLDETILTILSNTDVGKDVSIKLFDGFYVDATKTTRQAKNSNLVGGRVIVPPKIKVKGRQTKSYERRIYKSQTRN